MSIKNFLGKWELMPERSTYQQGTPPARGSYTIAQDGEKMTFTMEWTDSEGQDHNMAFAEVCDGEFHPMDSPVADEMSLTLVSDTELNSDARKDGVHILAANRKLIAPNELEITQSGLLPSGEWFHNLSYYRLSA